MWALNEDAGTFKINTTCFATTVAQHHRRCGMKNTNYKHERRERLVDFICDHADESIRRDITGISSSHYSTSTSLFNKRPVVER